MRSKIRSVRGRPRGIHHSRFDIRVLEYLVELSAKHKVHRAKFLSAIVDAWNNGKATCHELTITLRMKKENRAIFLITQDYMVVAQFSIPKHILEDTNPFSGFE